LIVVANLFCGFLRSKFILRQWISVLYSIGKRYNIGEQANVTGSARFKRLISGRKI